MWFNDYLSALGGHLTGSDLNQYQSSPQLQHGSFVNAQPYQKQVTVGGALATIYDIARPIPELRPSSALPVHVITAPELEGQDDLVVWYGHSTILLKIDGKWILIDPIFSDAAAPMGWIGTKRYNMGSMTELLQLPQIDVVLLSHDHYDHLDYKTIMGLKHKISQFVVPLGVGSHLQKWGFKSNQIHELDWWQKVTQGDITFVATPARHYTGRRVGMKNKTLWSSWVIKGSKHHIFFSGDTGYSSTQFIKIGEKYGPFDLTLIECGQYDERWKEIHMFPEQSLQAHLDVQGAVMLPIHWAAYTLAFHPWKEPIERLLHAARGEPRAVIATPLIGQVNKIESIARSYDPWWEF